MNQLHGYLEITIDGQAYGLKFGTNAIALFCELHGIELHELAMVNDAAAVRDLIWCAGKSWSLSKDEKFPFNQYQIGDWLDSISEKEMNRILKAIDKTKIAGKEIQAGRTTDGKEEEPKN